MFAKGVQLLICVRPFESINQLASKELLPTVPEQI
jgi:hypothetical protein